MSINTSFKRCVGEEEERTFTWEGREGVCFLEPQNLERYVRQSEAVKAEETKDMRMGSDREMKIDLTERVGTPCTVKRFDNGSGHLLLPAASGCSGRLGNPFCPLIGVRTWNPHLPIPPPTILLVIWLLSPDVSWWGEELHELPLAPAEGAGCLTAKEEAGKSRCQNTECEGVWSHTAFEK